MRCARTRPRSGRGSGLSGKAGSCAICAHGGTVTAIAPRLRQRRNLRRYWRKGAYVSSQAKSPAQFANEAYGGFNIANGAAACGIGWRRAASLTGADLALARSQDALVRQLLDEGLARAPANGLGFDVDSENRLRDKAGAAQPNLFVLGPLAAGVFWETTAAPELRARAAAIARALD